MPWDETAQPKFSLTSMQGDVNGNGNGTFQAGVKFALAANSEFVTVGDFNGDLRPDLLAATEITGSVSVLLNTCPCAPPDVTLTGPAQVCANSTNTIFVPAGGDSYSWTNYSANGTINSDINTPSITFMAGATGTMTLGVTVMSAGGCMAHKLIYIPINPLPILGNYPAAGTINPGGTTTVTPSAQPNQSPTISSITASAPGFTGNLSVNKTTGVVTINNANPPGNYTVTVTATDNCGATATKTFNLIVNGPPTITGASIARQAGAAAGSALLIATVNDAETPRANLVVMTVPPLPTGITVTSISAPNATTGNVTAIVVASCAAAPGPNLATLKVTDGNGLTAMANLTVNVTFALSNYAGGVADNLTLPAEPVFRRPAFSSAFSSAVWKKFDEPAADRFLGHSFINLPTNIVKAELEVRMKPLADDANNDGIALGLIPSTNTFTFSSQIANLSGAGGTWINNSPTIFTLNLSNLPGGVNLLPKLLADRFLDVLIQDDTAVDYLKLRIWTCPPPPRFGGLEFDVLGQAQVISDPNGSLRISNFGGSGNDGAAFVIGAPQLLAGAGVSFRPNKGLTIPNPGGELTLSVRGQFNGMDQTLGSVTFKAANTNNPPPTTKTWLALIFHRSA